MDASQLLVLFGGSSENVTYYLGLREEMGAPPDLCPCDPRDVRMVERLKQEQWKPQARMAWLDNFECLGGELYSTKQTALDDGGDDVDDDEAKSKSVDDMTETHSNSVNGSGSLDNSFVCGVHGCSQTFSSLASYESHYQRCHHFVCSECRRSFVSSFLLDVHLQENHDSYFSILASRIDMYRCLMEGCEVKFRTPELRKDHLVVEHKFPASFSFHQPLKTKSAPPAEMLKWRDSTAMDTGDASQETQTKKKQRRRKAKKEKMEYEERVDSNLSLGDEKSKATVILADSTMIETTGTTTATTETTATTIADTAMSIDSSSPLTESASPSPSAPTHRGKRGRGRGGRGSGSVPQTICFGRGSQRAFRVRGRGPGGHSDSATRLNIEEMDFGNLKDALPE